MVERRCYRAAGMTTWLMVLGSGSLAAWCYLLALHGRYWHCDQRLPATPTNEPDRGPPVVAVVPARNEAAVVARTLTSLLDQVYPGTFTIILVDDDSEDQTFEIARRVASAHTAGERLRVIRAPPRPAGWVGKMWAVATGVAHAERMVPDARYLLLTDADVMHHQGSLRRLVAQARSGAYALVSLMVTLEHRGAWAALLVPAFIYFFQQLYPFPRVNDPQARTAGAAGGCMLVDAAALRQAGGIAAIKGAVIDDCALARRLKRQGPIWLGLSRRERSVRTYDGLGGIWQMVARTAYSQLGYRPLLLALTLAGLGLVYLVPPALTLGGLTFGWHLFAGHLFAAPGAPLTFGWHLFAGHLFAGHLVAAGALAWLAMTVSFLPTLRLYQRSPWLAPALPLAALLFAGMTFDSARRHWCHQGARWKGRTEAGKAREERLAPAIVGEAEHHQRQQGQHGAVGDHAEPCQSATPPQTEQAARQAEH